MATFAEFNEENLRLVSPSAGVVVEYEVSAPAENPGAARQYLGSILGRLLGGVDAALRAELSSGSSGDGRIGQSPQPADSGQGDPGLSILGNQFAAGLLWPRSGIYSARGTAPLGGRNDVGSPVVSVFYNRDEKPLMNDPNTSHWDRRTLQIVMPESGQLAVGVYSNSWQQSLSPEDLRIGLGNSEPADPPTPPPVLIVRDDPSPTVTELHYHAWHEGGRSVADGLRLTGLNETFTDLVEQARTDMQYEPLTSQEASEFGARATARVIDSTLGIGVQLDVSATPDIDNTSLLIFNYDSQSEECVVTPSDNTSPYLDSVMLQVRPIIRSPQGDWRLFNQIENVLPPEMAERARQLGQAVVDFRKSLLGPDRAAEQ